MAREPSGRRSLNRHEIKTAGLILAIALLGVGLAACSSEPEPEKLPAEATQGGNVVQDDALKKQLQGDSGGGGGGGQDSGAPTGG